MASRWLPGDRAAPRFLRRWDDRSIGKCEFRLTGEKLARRAGERSWSVRRLILSTVSVNTVLWLLTAFVIWWAYEL